MSYVKYLDPTRALPAGAELERLYKELAAHLNADVKDQPKYKDLMNRILVAAMGNVVPAPVVVPRAAATIPAAAPIPAVVPRAAAAPKRAVHERVFNIGITEEDAELKV